MIKIIIPRSRKYDQQYRCHCQQIRQNTQPFFLFLIQSHKNNKKCKIPDKGVKEDRPVKLPAFQRWHYLFDQAAERLQIVNAIYHAVKHQKHHQQIVTVVKNPLRISFPDIRHIEKQEIQKTNRHHQICMYAFRMEHSLSESIDHGFHDFSTCKASRLHGRPDRFLTSKQHGSKQPVLKQDVAR